MKVKMQNQPRGVSRLAYFFLSLGLIVFSVVITILPLGFMGVILITALFLMLVGSRLKNIGWNPWLSLLILIPIANLFIYFSAFCLPPNYGQTKKFDAAAKVLLTLCIIFFLLIPIIIVAGLTVIGSQLDSSFSEVEKSLKAHEQTLKTSEFKLEQEDATAPVKAPTPAIPSPKDYLVRQ